MKERKQMECINYEFGGDLFIDIGANVGMWVRDLGHLYDRIVCIEPGREAFNILKASTHMDFADGDITYINKACWSKSGETLALMAGAGTADTGNFTVFGEKLLKPENVMHGGECTTMMLDELTNEVKEEEKDILIKIDTEGADWNILEGGKNFISTHHPVIAIENHFHMHYDKDQYYSLISFLHAQDYNILEFKNPEYLAPYNYQRMFGGDREYTGTEMYDKHYQMIFEPRRK